MSRVIPIPSFTSESSMDSSSMIIRTSEPVSEPVIVEPSFSKADNSFPIETRTPLNMLSLLVKVEGVLQFRLITQKNSSAATQVLNRGKMMSADAQDPNHSAAFGNSGPRITVTRQSMMDMIRQAVFGGHNYADTSLVSYNIEQHDVARQRNFSFYYHQMQIMEEKILFILLTLAAPELFLLSDTHDSIFLFPVLTGESSQTSVSLLDWTSRRFSSLKALYHQRWTTLFQMKDTNTPIKHDLQQLFDFVRGKPTSNIPTTSHHESRDESTITPPIQPTSILQKLEPFITPDMNLHQRVQARALFKQQQQQQQQLIDSNKRSLSSDTPTPTADTHKLVRFADALRLLIVHKQKRNRSASMNIPLSEIITHLSSLANKAQVMSLLQSLAVTVPEWITVMNWKSVSSDDPSMTATVVLRETHSYQSIRTKLCNASSQSSSSTLAEEEEDIVMDIVCPSPKKRKVHVEHDKHSAVALTESPPHSMSSSTRELKHLFREMNSGARI